MVAPQKPRSPRNRLILGILGGSVALLCLGGAGIAITVYNQATKIDRSHPDTVTGSFLIAYIDNRSDEQAKLYECKSPNLAGIKSLRDQMIGREKQFNETVTAVVGVPTIKQVSPRDYDISIDLTIRGIANGQVKSRHVEDWQFTVVDEGSGWRVCGATKIGP